MLCSDCEAVRPHSAAPLESLFSQQSLPESYRLDPLEILALQLEGSSGNVWFALVVQRQSPLQENDPTKSLDCSFLHSLL